MDPKRTEILLLDEPPLQLRESFRGDPSIARPGFEALLASWSRSRSHGVDEALGLALLCAGDALIRSGRANSVTFRTGEIPVAVE